MFFVQYLLSKLFNQVQVNMFSSPVKGYSFDFGSPIHGHAAPVYHGNENSHRAQTAHDSYHINRPHPHGELSAHNMDRIFIKIIDEIHYEYMKFEKTERIRIENWVNKLVSTVSINNSVLGKIYNSIIPTYSYYLLLYIRA